MSVEPAGLKTAPDHRELSVAGAAFTGIIAAELLLSRSWGMFSQIPWLDECLTNLVVNDPSFTHALAALRAGVENTPPGFLAVMWPVARLFGGLSVVGMRVQSFMFGILACVAVYGTCRLFVDRRRASLGALVMSIHPIVIVQLFMIRFYGFWLAGTAWLVYFTARQALEPGRRRFLYARCALAILVVSAHWFGLIGLGLVTAADFLARRDARERIDAALPMILGVLCVAAFSPFLLSQREGLTVATWIEPMTISGLARELRAIAGLAAVAFIVVMAAWRVVAKEPLQLAPGEWAALAPGFALLLFPAVLIVLSLLVQPVARAGYMIPAVIPIGIMAALATPGVVGSRRLLGIVVMAGVAGVGAVELRRHRNVTAREFASVLDRSVVVADSLNAAGVRPILFLRDAEMLPVLVRRPDLAPATAIIDFDGDGGGLPRVEVYARDGTRRLNRVYPQFRLARVDSLDRLARFAVITGARGDSALKRLFPQYQISPLGEGVHVAIRR